jgi:DNA-binding transcriptional regulator GbsR (MarR family)
VGGRPLKVKRCVRILIAVGTWGPLGLDEISADTGIDQKALSWIMSDLEEIGLVRRYKRPRLTPGNLARQFFTQKFPGFYSKKGRGFRRNPEKRRQVWRATEKLGALLA